MTSPTPPAPQWVQAPDGSWQQAAPTPPAPKKPSELPKVLGALALCLVGGFVVVMIGAAATSTKSPTAASANAAAPASSETLAQWGARTKHYVDDVSAATSKIGASATSYDTPAMVAGCQDLRVAATGWRTELPSPDPAFDALLGPAIDSYVLGADKCISAGSGTTLSAADLQASGEAIDQASASIGAATTYLAAHA